MRRGADRVDGLHSGTAIDLFKKLQGFAGAALPRELSRAQASRTGERGAAGLRRKEPEERRPDGLDAARFDQFRRIRSQLGERRDGGRQYRNARRKGLRDWEAEALIEIGRA